MRQEQILTIISYFDEHKQPSVVLEQFLNSLQLEVSEDTIASIEAILSKQSLHNRIKRFRCKEEADVSLQQYCHRLNLYLDAQRQEGNHRRHLAAIQNQILPIQHRKALTTQGKLLYEERVGGRLKVEHQHHLHQQLAQQQQVQQNVQMHVQQQLKQQLQHDTSALLEEHAYCDRNTIVDFADSFSEKEQCPLGDTRLSTGDKLRQLWDRSIGTNSHKIPAEGADPEGTPWVITKIQDRAMYVILDYYPQFLYGLDSANLPAGFFIYRYTVSYPHPIYENLLCFDRALIAQQEEKGCLNPLSIRLAQDPLYEQHPYSDFKEFLSEINRVHSSYTDEENKKTGELVSELLQEGNIRTLQYYWERNRHGLSCLLKFQGVAGLYKFVKQCVPRLERGGAIEQYCIATMPNLSSCVEAEAMVALDAYEKFTPPQRQWFDQLLQDHHECIKQGDFIVLINAFSYFCEQLGTFKPPLQIPQKPPQAKPIHMQVFLSLILKVLRQADSPQQQFNILHQLDLTPESVPLAFAQGIRTAIPAMQLTPTESLISCSVPECSVQEIKIDAEGHVQSDQLKRIEPFQLDAFQKPSGVLYIPVKKLAQHDVPDAENKDLRDLLENEAIKYRLFDSYDSNSNRKNVSYDWSIDKVHASNTTFNPCEKPPKADYYVLLSKGVPHNKKPDGDEEFYENRNSRSAHDKSSSSQSFYHNKTLKKARKQEELLKTIIQEELKASWGILFKTPDKMQDSGYCRIQNVVKQLSIANLMPNIYEKMDFTQFSEQYSKREQYTAWINYILSLLDFKHLAVSFSFSGVTHTEHIFLFRLGYCRLEEQTLRAETELAFSPLPPYNTYVYRGLSCVKMASAITAGVNAVGDFVGETEDILSGGFTFNFSVYYQPLSQRDLSNVNKLSDNLYYPCTSDDLSQKSTVFANDFDALSVYFYRYVFTFPVHLVFSDYEVLFSKLKNSKMSVAAQTKLLLILARITTHPRATNQSIVDIERFAQEFVWLLECLSNCLKKNELPLSFHFRNPALSDRMEPEDTLVSFLKGIGSSLEYAKIPPTLEEFYGLLLVEYAAQKQNKENLQAFREHVAGINQFGEIYYELIAAQVMFYRCNAQGQYREQYLHQAMTTVLSYTSGLHIRNKPLFFIYTLFAEKEQSYDNRWERDMAECLIPLVKVLTSVTGTNEEQKKQQETEFIKACQNMLTEDLSSEGKKARLLRVLRQFAQINVSRSQKLPTLPQLTECIRHLSVAGYEEEKIAAVLSQRLPLTCYGNQVIGYSLSKLVQQIEQLKLGELLENEATMGLLKQHGFDIPLLKKAHVKIQSNSPQQKLEGIEIILAQMKAHKLNAAQVLAQSLFSAASGSEQSIDTIEGVFNLLSSGWVSDDPVKDMIEQSCLHAKETLQAFFETNPHLQAAKTILEDLSQYFDGLARTEAINLHQLQVIEAQLEDCNRFIQTQFCQACEHPGSAMQRWVTDFAQKRQNYDMAVWRKFFQTLCGQKSLPFDTVWSLIFNAPVPYDTAQLNQIITKLSALFSQEAYHALSKADALAFVHIAVLTGNLSINFGLIFSLGQKLSQYDGIIALLEGIHRLCIDQVPHIAPLIEAWLQLTTETLDVNPKIWNDWLHYFALYPDVANAFNFINIFLNMGGKANTILAIMNAAALLHRDNPPGPDDMMEAIMELKNMSEQTLNQIKILYDQPGLPKPALKVLLSALRGKEIASFIKQSELDPSGKRADPRALQGQFSLAYLRDFIDRIGSLFSGDLQLSAAVKDELFAQCLYINTIGFYLSPTNNGKVLLKYSIPELQDLAQVSIAELRKDPNQVQHYLHFLAVCREIIFRFTPEGEFPYAHQLVPSLMVAQYPQTNLAFQMLPGEGKTITTALQSLALFARQSSIVVVDPGNGLLNQRDFDKFLPVYRALRIPCYYITVNNTTEELKEILGHESGVIVYCTMADLSLIWNRLAIEGMALNHIAKNALPVFFIANEGDIHVFDSEICYNLSVDTEANVDPTVNPYAWLYPFLNQFMQQKPCPLQPTQNGRLQIFAQTVMDLYNYLATRVTAEQYAQLNQFSSYQLARWLVASWKAMQLTEERDYVIQPFTNKQGQAYQRGCPLIDSVPQPLSHFSDGVDQCLQALLAEKYKQSVFPIYRELEHVATETSLDVFRHCQETDGTLILNSGTMGESSELEELARKLQPIVGVDLPRYRQVAIKRNTLKLSSNELSWQADIHNCIRAIRKNAETENAPILVVCRDIPQVYSISHYLGQKSLQNLSVVTGTDGRSLEELQQLARRENAITLATPILARGADIIPQGLPLIVIQISPEKKRQTEQIIYRIRIKGEYYAIFNKAAIPRVDDFFLFDLFVDDKSRIQHHQKQLVNIKQQERQLRELFGDITRPAQAYCRSVMALFYSCQRDTRFNSEGILQLRQQLLKEQQRLIEELGRAWKDILMDAYLSKDQMDHTDIARHFEFEVMRLMDAYTQNVENHFEAIEMISVPKYVAWLQSFPYQYTANDSHHPDSVSSDNDTVHFIFQCYTVYLHYQHQPNGIDISESEKKLAAIIRECMNELNRYLREEENSRLPNKERILQVKELLQKVYQLGDIGVSSSPLISAVNPSSSTGQPDFFKQAASVAQDQVTIEYPQPTKVTADFIKNLHAMKTSMDAEHTRSLRGRFLSSHKSRIYGIVSASLEKLEQLLPTLEPMGANNYLGPR